MKQKTKNNRFEGSQNYSRVKIAILGTFKDSWVESTL